MDKNKSRINNKTMLDYDEVKKKVLGRLNQSNNVEDKPTKRFIVKTSECYNSKMAIDKFNEWRQKYKYNEEFEFIRIHKESVYVIEYRLSSSKKPDQTTIESLWKPNPYQD